ncbi:hypothetical protein AYJ57_21610 (plasmid) [Salipiger sp. CCB-MM3]|uniref:hypothetical protein n=1 Tax=Salipiger sp. CCB-MM3 TaxID=1792508 RepID=UPI00080AC26F|nr:hypothetical protein [Salipiger sp. CCB-MM3]ANT63071.1 hypothetical protein AYJ57_21610 [Salipiger sp. CCB-MM3]
MRPQFKSQGQFSVVRKKTKSVQQGFQEFDQKSVFDTTEPSQGNVLASVISTGDVPVMKVRSDAFGAGSKEVTVRFRSEEAAKKSAPAEDVYSSFAIKPACHGEVPRIADSLQPGDLVELQGVIVDQFEQSEVFPWNAKTVVPAAETRTTVAMSEALCSILHSVNPKDDAKKDFRIVIASPAEAQEVTDVLGDLTRLKEYLGFKHGAVNGFVIRGTHRAGGRELKGAACYRTLQDDERGLSDEAVILNFLKTKSHVFAPYMSAKNPWEIIPLHVVNVLNSASHRLESLTKRYSFMAQIDGSHQEMEFGHANVVLDFRSGSQRPVCRHFNLCRQKPIRIDTGLPTRARPRKLKTNEESESSKITKLFG